MACSPRTAAHIFVLVVLLNAGIVITGSVLHELGHALLGLASGCTDVQIVLFDGGFAATEMACPATADTGALAAGASIFIVPVAGLFLVLRAVPEYSIGWILLGVHLFGSAADLQRTVLPDAAALYGIPVLGALFILHGQNQLIVRLLERHATDVPSSLSVPE